MNLFSKFSYTLIYFSIFVPISFFYRLNKNKKKNNSSWIKRESQFAKDIISKEP